MAHFYKVLDCKDITHAEKRKQRAQRDMEVIHVGVGATKHVGSDSYPYYVAYAQLSKKGKPVVGMYQPGSHFERDWTDGYEVVDPFDPKAKPEFYITLFRNRWWACDKDGVRAKPHRIDEYSFGMAISYRDPSF